MLAQPAEVLDGGRAPAPDAHAAAIAGAAGALIVAGGGPAAALHRRKARNAA